MYVCMHLCLYIIMYKDLSPLGSKNNIFNVIVDVRVPEVTCQFLNGPVTSATCTFRYGTDPTYINLPYTDSSNGTNVSNVTVPLNALLQSGTLHYYVASSMEVRLQGNFLTGMHNYLTIAFHVMEHLLISMISMHFIIYFIYLPTKACNVI